MHNLSHEAITWSFTIGLITFLVRLVQQCIRRLGLIIKLVALVHC